jgi:response regulator RpfG family c-di-GMP phosphodiesterase
VNEQAKILVVDDDPDQTFAYSRALRSAGYKVFEAYSGEEAARLARAERPDLVLLDVVLPDATGIEVCKQIKSDPELSRILVVNVSGSQTSPDDTADGLEAGADGYLTKPVSPRALLAQVRAYLRIKNAESALVDQQERELTSLGDLSSPSPTPVSRQLFGAAPLRDTAPQVFEELVERYGVLLDLALEQRAYKVEHNVSEGFHVLVTHLGFLKAGPRDVVDIHSAALKKRAGESNPLKARAYVEEGRLAVLELMGHMVSYYRNHSMGARGNVVRKRPGERRPAEE